MNAAEGGQMEHDYNMNGVDPMSDYRDSLHFKISQNLANQAQILNSGLQGMVQYQKVESPVEFGKTKLTDYQAIAPLGKGTYGEVNKCFHIQTNSVVAIKTFLFEVSFPKSF